MVLIPGVRDWEQLKEEPVNVAGEPLHFALATPESASLTLPLTVITEVRTTAPSRGVVTVTNGGVLSSLTVALVDAELPATSAVDRTMDWELPSVLTSTGSGQDAIPDRASAQT